MNHGSKIRSLPLGPLFEPKDSLAFLRFCRPSVSLEIFLEVWEWAQEYQSLELIDYNLFAPAKDRCLGIWPYSKAELFEGWGQNLMHRNSAAGRWNCNWGGYKLWFVKALFTFAGRISAKREAPDVAIFDESMANPSLLPVV
jgi:hypothetical protein